jgi:hypothetical protein
VSGEAALSRAIQDALENIGCLVARVQSGTARGAGGHHMRLARKGTPDLWVCGLHWHGWLECKLPGEEPTEGQLKWHRAARSAGVRVEVVRSVEQALRVVTGRQA